MEITGRIIADAKVVTLKDERKVVNFAIVINDYYKPKGSSEGKQVTTFSNCAYWINTSIATVLKKGNIVEVSGRLYVSSYNNLDGEAKASIHLHSNNIKVHSIAKSKLETEPSKITEPLDNLPF